MGKDNQILLVMVNERGFLSLAVSSASKASVLRAPDVGGYGSRFTDRFPRSRSALLLAPIFPRLSHPKQSLSVFCVHRLRYADTVSRACGIRGKAATDSDGRRPPIPIESGHPIRTKAATLLIG